MNRNLAQLVERREILVAQAAAQRAELAQHFRALHKPLTLADRAVGLFRYIRSHPAFLVGASFVIGTLLRKYTQKWPFLAWAGAAWRLGRSLFT